MVARISYCVFVVARDLADSNGSDTHTQIKMDDSFLDHFLQISQDAESWMTGTPRHFTLFARTFMKIKSEKEISILDSERKFKVELWIELGVSMI